jgi:hypothetical protein
MSSTRGDEELNSRVRLLLVMHFNESELRDLCFDLGVDYESLPGHAKSDKARELLGYARRHARWEELMLHESGIRSAPRRRCLAAICRSSRFARSAWQVAQYTTGAGSNHHSDGR